MNAWTPAEMQADWDAAAAAHHARVQVVDEFTLPATDCLNHRDSDCDGPVEYHAIGASMRAWPRCDRHWRMRMDSAENSMERYADSSVAPSWFDPTYAGESWDE